MTYPENHLSKLHPAFPVKLELSHSKRPSELVGLVAGRGTLVRGGKFVVDVGLASSAWISGYKKLLVTNHVDACLQRTAHRFAAQVAPQTRYSAEDKKGSWLSSVAGPPESIIPQRFVLQVVEVPQRHQMWLTVSTSPQLDAFAEE